MLMRTIHRLTFRTLLISTTIGDLKKKIQDAVSTKPAPTRQRLIYRGKALVHDETTLADVFGREAVSKIQALECVEC